MTRLPCQPSQLQAVCLTLCLLAGCTSPGRVDDLDRSFWWESETGTDLQLPHPDALALLVIDGVPFLILPGDDPGHATLTPLDETWKISFPTVTAADFAPGWMAGTELVWLALAAFAEADPDTFTDDAAALAIAQRVADNQRVTLSATLTSGRRIRGMISADPEPANDLPQPRP